MSSVKCEVLFLRMKRFDVEEFLVLYRNAHLIASLYSTNESSTRWSTKLSCVLGYSDPPRLSLPDLTTEAQRKSIV